MKKLLILLSLLSVLIFVSPSYSIDLSFNGATLGERIPDYYLVQFQYDYTKAGIDYYTARKVDEAGITRIAIYNNKLMSIDLINMLKYKVFFLAVFQLVYQDFGQYDLLNSISKDVFEMIWIINKDNKIVLLYDEQSGSSNLSFFSTKVLKQYLKETTVM
jgi:hypothetical protein